MCVTTIGFYTLKEKTFIGQLFMMTGGLEFFQYIKEKEIFPVDICQSYRETLLYPFYSTTNYLYIEISYEFCRIKRQGHDIYFQSHNF